MIYCWYHLNYLYHLCNFVDDRSVITNSNSFVDGNENISREVLDFDFENSAVKDAEDHKAAEADHEEATTRPVDVESSLGDSAQGSVGTSSDIHKNVISQMVSQKGSHFPSTQCISQLSISMCMVMLTFRYI